MGIKDIAKEIHKWWAKNPHTRQNAICRYGHQTNCDQCQSNEERWSYERVSEVGR